MKTKDDIKMEAEIFFDSYQPDALRQALDYAGDEGFVASMPQLLHARANALYDNIIWNSWFVSNSEESVIKTPQGNHVVVVVHGGGIYTSPERFERTYRARVNRANLEGFTGQYAGKISAQEARDVLEGKLPESTEIPVYSFNEFKQGVTDLPIRYAIVLDFEIARRAKSGYETFNTLKDDPNMIARAGGVEPLAMYLDKAQVRHNNEVMGNWHPYNRIDLDQPQTRVLFLAGNSNTGNEDSEDHLYGYDAKYGISGNSSIIGVARYVAVAPQSVSTSLRNLDFEV